MKKTIALLMIIAVICTLMLASCGNKETEQTKDKGTVTEEDKSSETKQPADTSVADPDDTSADTKGEDPAADTTADTAEDTRPVVSEVSIKSEEDIKKLDQTLNYEVDHHDFGETKPGAGGDIVGTWLSDIMSYKADMDNDPSTLEDVHYRTILSFNADGTGYIRIMMNEKNMPMTYTIGENGSIEIKAQNVSLPNATYTVTEDGKYLMFKSDTLTANFMKAD